MAQERSEVQKLFEKQEVERAKLVRRFIKELNDAGFDWNLPDGFSDISGYEGKGLLVDNGWGVPWSRWSGDYHVLSPDKGYVSGSKYVGYSPVSLLGGGMTGSGETDLNALERTVNVVLVGLQRSQVSA